MGKTSDEIISLKNAGHHRQKETPMTNSAKEVTTRAEERPEEVVTASSWQTNATALTDKTVTERENCHLACKTETCHPACNKPCSRTEGDKQQQHHHHHHQHHHHQQQEYSSSSSPQQALFRATLSLLHNGPFPGPHSLISTTGPFQGYTLSSSQQVLSRVTLSSLHNRPFSGLHSHLSTTGLFLFHTLSSPQQALFRATLSPLHSGPFPGSALSLLHNRLFSGPNSSLQGNIV